MSSLFFRNTWKGDRFFGGRLMQSSAEADWSVQAGEMPHLSLSGWPTLPYDCSWPRWRFLVNFICFFFFFLHLASCSQLMYRFLEKYTVFGVSHHSWIPTYFLLEPSICYSPVLVLKNQLMQKVNHKWYLKFLLDLHHANDLTGILEIHSWKYCAKMHWSMKEGGAAFLSI